MCKKRLTILFNASILIYVLLVAGIACAATQTYTLEGSHTLTEDLNIALSVSPNEGQAAIKAGNGDSIIGNAGVKVSVDIPDVNNSYMTYFGIMAEGGTVSIDKYYFEGGEADTATKASQIGIRAKEGAQVSIGDDAEIYANSKGVSVMASGTGTVVTIGDNAKLSGTTSSNAYGTLTAVESNISGEGAGKIVVGDNAYIINDGYMSSNASSHIAIRSYGYTEITSITIGKEAQIYAQGSGFNNYAIQAGDADYGTRGTVEVGEKSLIATSGDYSHALYSSNVGSVISLDREANITTHGDGAHAVLAKGGGEVYIGDESLLLTNGSDSAGIFSLGLGKSTLLWPDENLLGTSVIRTGDGVIVETLDSGKGVIADSRDGYGAEVRLGTNNTIITNGDNSAFGLYAVGSEALITAEDDLVILTAGSDAHGIRAYDGGSVDTLTTTIRTTGEKAHGVYTSRSSDIYIGDGSIIATDGEGSRGIYAFDRGVVEAGRVDVTTSGRDSNGVRADISCRVSLGADSVITTYGEESMAVLASKSFVEVGEGSKITTYGDSSIGVGSFGDGAYTLIHDGVRIQTFGEKSAGIRVIQDGKADIGRVSVSTTGERSYGLSMFRGSIVSLDAGAVIKTEGKNAYGVWADENVYLDIGAGTIVETAGENSYGIYLMDGGTVNMHGATIKVDTDKTGYAIIAHNSSDLCKQDSLIKGDGIFNILGNITAQDFRGYSATVDLVMRDTSRFIGATRLYHDKCFIDLSFVGSDSLWDVTGNSNLTSLGLDSAVVDYSLANLGTTITTGVLDGPGGTFIMKTDIMNQTGDKLVVTDTMNGSNHKITVLNNGSANTTGNEVVTLVDTADTTGAFALTNIVDLGGWQYGLQQVAGGLGREWQLATTGSSTYPASSAVNTFYAAYLLNYADTQTLIQRLGDLRNTPSLSGFWFRAHGGKFESNSKSFVKPFDMDYWGVQLGYDRKYKIGWDGDFYAGVLFGYSKGDLDYLKNGSGNVDSKMLGVYGTFVKPNGFFADLVLKYQWMDNEFDVLDSAGDRVTGDDVTTDGFGASLELGQRIHLKGEGKPGWYVEPQMQLSYMRQSGGYFNASNGLRIGVEPFTSILGRLGMLMGYETERNNFYAKVSKVREFDGDVTVTANSQPIPESFGNSWWVYGLGITSSVNDRNSIYLDIERASGGGSFTQAWAVKAGWRMTF